MLFIRCIAMQDAHGGSFTTHGLLHGNHMLSESGSHFHRLIVGCTVCTLNEHLHGPTPPHERVDCSEVIKNSD